jgi:hypothetical protein
VVVASRDYYHQGQLLTVLQCLPDGSYTTTVKWQVAGVDGSIHEMAISGSTLYVTDQERIFCMTIPSTPTFGDQRTPMPMSPVKCGGSGNTRLPFVVRHMICANNRLYVAAFVDTVDIAVYCHTQTIDQHARGALPVNTNYWTTVASFLSEYIAGLTVSLDGELSLWSVNRHHRIEDGNNNPTLPYAPDDRKLKRRRILRNGSVEFVLCEDPFPGTALQYRADISVFQHPWHHDQFIVVAANDGLYPIGPASRQNSVVAVYK